MAFVRGPLAFHFFDRLQDRGVHWLGPDDVQRDRLGCPLCQGRAARQKRRARAAARAAAKRPRTQIMRMLAHRGGALLCACGAPRMRACDNAAACARPAHAPPKKGRASPRARQTPTQLLGRRAAIHEQRPQFSFSPRPAQLQNCGGRTSRRSGGGGGPRDARASPSARPRADSAASREASKALADRGKALRKIWPHAVTNAARGPDDPGNLRVWPRGRLLRRSAATARTRRRARLAMPAARRAQGSKLTSSEGPASGATLTQKWNSRGARRRRRPPQYLPGAAPFHLGRLCDA